MVPSYFVLPIMFPSKIFLPRHVSRYCLTSVGSSDAMLHVTEKKRDLLKMELLNLRFSNSKFYPDNESDWITNKSIIFNLPTTNFDLVKITIWYKNESFQNFESGKIPLEPLFNLNGVNGVFVSDIKCVKKRENLCFQFKFNLFILFFSLKIIIN